MKKILFALLVLSYLPLYAQVALNNGLVAYYPLKGSFSDASGNGNNGTALGGIVFGADQYGNNNSAAVFDGIDDYISVPAAASLTPSGQFSIAYRFQTGSSALQVLVSKSNWTGGIAPDNFQFQSGINGGSVLSSNGLYFASSHAATCTGNTGLGPHYSFGSNTALNQWYCVLLTFENGVKRVYMNGSLVSTATVSGTSTNTSIDACNGGTLQIGARWQNDPRWFRGSMSELRIYNRALNAQEADSLCKLRPQNDGLVINRYAAINGRVADCSNGFSVDDATGFGAGDTVLMIQMQGASIDSSNTPEFGTILAMNGAGNFEYNIVQSVSGNIIRLRNKILKSYDIPAGKVQLVRVPSFGSYTVAQTHGCLPWNGSKGGVFAIRVNGSLTLNAGISVNGMGFRGGLPLLSAQASCNKTDYFYPPTSNEGGQKGEGIAILSTAKRYGRGAAANGGGGGNDHNAGGAGGGTFGIGGDGGQQFNVGSCASNPNIGGIGGGIAAANRTGRLLLGGGGGAGHGNERAEKAGGNGGGILLIDAGSITGNNQVLSANGLDGVQCSAPGNPGGGCMNDGGGGGGGGGQVFITATSITANVGIEAKGGKGSDIYLGNGVTPSGPGGGGGGGGIFIVSSTASRTTQSVAGGAAGSIPQRGIRFGAEAGNSGQSLSSSAVPFATAAFTSTAVKPTFRDSTVACLGRQFFNTTVPAVAGATQASWTITGVGTSTQQNPVFTFPAYGTYELILQVTDANGCSDTIQRTIGVSQPFGTTLDSTFCASKELRLTARNGIAWVWSPAQRLSSPTTQSVLITDVPRNTPSGGTYQVQVTIAPGCVVTDTFRIGIDPAPYSEFSYRPNPPQPNIPVAFTNESREATSYLWDFGDGSVSREENATYLFMETRVFNVCLVAYTDKNCPDTSCRNVSAEFRQTVAMPTGFSPNGDGNNDILRLKGGPFSNMKMAVFNRWGQKVFETTNPQSGWDGNYRGAPQPVDVYPYVVNVTFMDGTTETIKGNVTLLR